MATDQEKLILSISADTAQMKRALDKMRADTKSTTDGMVKNFGNVDKATKYTADNMNKSIGATRQAVQGLSFQMNDIATSLAGGASPFQVMMQQGSQVSQVFQDLKRQGGSMGGALVGAFSSMLNPISLVSFGLIALAGYAYQYFTAVEDGSDDANKELKKHADALDSIVSQYGDLAPEAKRILSSMQEAAKSREAIKELNATLAGMRTDAVEKLNKEIGKIDGISNEAKRAVQDAFGDRTIFAKVTESFQALVGIIERGEDPTAKMLDLMKELSKLHMEAPKAGFGGMLEALKSMVPMFGEITTQQKAVINLQDAITAATEKSKKAVEDLLGLYGRIPTTLDPLGQLGGPFFAPTDLSKWEEWGKTAGSSFNKGLEDFLTSDKPLSHANLESSFGEKLLAMLQVAPGGGIQIFSGRRTLERQKELYDEAIRKYGRADLPGHQVAFPTPEAPHVSGRAADLRFDNEAVKRWAQENAKQFGLEFKVEGEYWHISEIQTAKAAKQRATAYEDWLADSNRAIEQQKREIAIHGDTTLSINEQTAAIEKAKFIQEGLLAAQAQGIPINAALRAEVEKQAEAMANLGLQAANAKTAQEEQTRRSKEHAQALQQFSNQIAGIGQTAISGFANDLRNGVEAGDAFVNMLNRVIDGLLNMATQALFSEDALGGIIKTFIGGLGGFGGGGFPAAPAAPGGGLYHSGGRVTAGGGSHDGRSFPASTWNGAPRFARGGMVGLRPGEVPIIAHAGEMVIPRGQVGKGGGTTTINNNQSVGDIAIDMSGSGLVTANSEDAKMFGLKIQKLVQLEMVKESRPGGLLRQVPSR